MKRSPAKTRARTSSTPTPPRSTHRLRRTVIASTIASIIYFGFAFVALTDVRTNLYLAAALCSALTSLAYASFVYVLEPRFGAPSAVMLISLSCFVLASLAAALAPDCPTAPGSRCSPIESVAAGFPVMLIAPTIALTVFVARSFARLTGSLYRRLRTR